MVPSSLPRAKMSEAARSRRAALCVPYAARPRLGRGWRIGSPPRCRGRRLEEPSRLQDVIDELVADTQGPGDADSRPAPPVQAAHDLRLGVPFGQEAGGLRGILCLDLA